MIRNVPFVGVVHVTTESVPLKLNFTNQLFLSFWLILFVKKEIESIENPLLGRAHEGL